MQNFDFHAIDSPLALIALFVVAIEMIASLMQLGNLDQKQKDRLVWFIVTYPIFISSVFFAFLWFNNFNLYPPSQWPVELLNTRISETVKEQTSPNKAFIESSQKRIGELEKSNYSDPLTIGSFGTASPAR